MELRGSDHRPWLGDTDSVIDEVERFLTGAIHRPRSGSSKMGPDSLSRREREIVYLAIEGEGCTNTVPSCCRLVVFVQQPAKSIAPTHPGVNRKRRPLELFLLRCLKVKRTVRSLSVVMANVDPEDALEVAPGEDEAPVQAFRPHGSDPALAESIGTRRPDRGAYHLQALGRKHLIERVHLARRGGR